MKDYALYYSYKGIGDVLLVVIDNSLSMTNYKKINNVVVIYNDETIIGYNIFDIKDIIKIKNEGMICFPNPTLVEVINTLLKNAGVPTLEIQTESGYFIGEVTDVQNSIVTVNLDKEQVDAKEIGLNVGDKVVVAKAGTRLCTGETVKDGHICKNKELGIKDNGEQITILDKEAEIGKDFFYLEEK